MSGLEPRFPTTYLAEYPSLQAELICARLEKPANRIERETGEGGGQKGPLACGLEAQKAVADLRASIGSFRSAAGAVFCKLILEN